MKTKIIRDAEFERIARVVADYYNVNYNNMADKTRSRDVVTARHFCMLIFREGLKSTHLRAGGFFDRDHASCVASVKTIKNLMDTEQQMRLEFAEIKMKLHYEGINIKLYHKHLLPKFCHPVTYAPAV